MFEFIVSEALRFEGHECGVEERVSREKCQVVGVLSTVASVSPRKMVGPSLRLALSLVLNEWVQVTKRVEGEIMAANVG